jgi:hypothetical protein
MCTSVVGPIEQNLVSGETSNQFVPLTPWLPVSAWLTVIALITLANATTQFRAAAAYQTAVNQKQPDTADTLEGTPTWATASVTEVCTGTQTPTVSGKFWIRFGVMVNNSTTQGVMSRAMVALSLQGY